MQVAEWGKGLGGDGIAQFTLPFVQPGAGAEEAAGGLRAPFTGFRRMPGRGGEGHGGGGEGEVFEGAEQAPEGGEEGDSHGIRRRDFPKREARHTGP